jgi:hypothetical protein
VQHWFKRRSTMGEREPVITDDDDDYYSPSIIRAIG